MSESTDSGDPWRKFRAPDDLWNGLAGLVGERGRSKRVRDLIQWQLDHPNADLSAVPNEQRLLFVVDIHLTPDGRRAEVLPMSGATGAKVDQLRREIARAIAEHFNPPETEAVPTKKTRRAAK